MPLPSELIERLADAGARRELGRWLDGLAGARPLAVERGEWVPTWTGLTVVGTPTYAGRWWRLERFVFWEVEISAGGANTTASTAGTTRLNNLPFNLAQGATCTAWDGATGASYGVGGGRPATGALSMFTPTWAATNATIILSGWYEMG
jgi:hypothetical protein